MATIDRNKLVIALAALVAVGAVTFALVWKPTAKPEPGADVAEANDGAQVQESEAKANLADASVSSGNGETAKASDSAKSTDKADKPKRKRPGVGAEILSSDEFDHLPEADRPLAKKLQDALDNEDFEATLVAAQTAYRSANPELRQRAVEALGWYGEKSLGVLAPMMADTDPDVARSAMDAWENALQDVEKPATRQSIAQLALQTLDDEQALTMIGAQFSAAATERIDALEDEAKAMALRVEAVQSLVDMLDGHPSEVRTKASAEIYENLTGHPWKGVDEAERYLRDPDNYEPPEDDDEQ